MELEVRSGLGKSDEERMMGPFLLFKSEFFLLFNFLILFLFNMKHNFYDTYLLVAIS